jgi:hypothetical protein
MRRVVLAAAFAAFAIGGAQAQTVTVLPGACPPGAANMPPNGPTPLYADSTGQLCTASANAAGSAIIGKVGIDQTTPGTTNKVSISGYNGAVIDNAIGTQSANAVSVMPAPSSTAPYAATTSIAGSALTVANVKTSTGNVYGVSCAQTNASITYLQFYNTAGTPVLGTSVVWFLAIPPSGTLTIPTGAIALANFATGIGIGASTTPTGVGTPGVAPACTIFYK